MHPSPLTFCADDLVVAINDHDAARVAQFFAGDYQGFDVSRSMECRGKTRLRLEMGRWLTAFPDLQFTIQDTLAKPGHLLIEWTLEGTHGHTFLQVPATGRHLTINGFSRLIVREGLIVEGRHLWDMAGMLRAMKLLPELSLTAP